MIKLSRKKEPTLVKEVMADLEKGDRTEEQLKVMRMREFQEMRRASIPPMNVIISSTIFSTATTNWER